MLFNSILRGCVKLHIRSIFRKRIFSPLPSHLTPLYPDAIRIVTWNAFYALCFGKLSMAIDI
jgi:hypothetical protein